MRVFISPYNDDDIILGTNIDALTFDGAYDPKIFSTN